VARGDRDGVTVGQKHHATGRLVALACPEGVAQKRLRKAAEDARRRCKPLSERQREMCRWQVLFGNAPRARLSAEQLWRVYRLRWQVELLFKRFKSRGGLRRSSCEKPARVQCEW
jgi:IS4 transposase